MSSQIPKYLFLKAQIKEWVFSGELHPGDQIQTEYQLAEQFQMSRQTVRMAINELVHEGVLFRVQGKGTFLSQNVLKNKSEEASHRIIAVITTYISDYIFPSIIRGIESRLSQDNYSMLLLSTNNNFDTEAQALDNILQRPVDGVILEPTKSTYHNPNIRRYLSLIAYQVPMIALHASYVELGTPCVRMDDEKGGVLAIEHLHELGHARIGMIGKMDDFQGNLRLRGFIHGHQEFGVTLHPEWIQLYETGEEAERSVEYARRFQKAAKKDKPTAIICYNDQIAAEMYMALEQSGFTIPDDVSIISFDDSQWAQANQCTSLQHPKQAMGVKVAEYMLKAIQNKNDSSKEFIDDCLFVPELIARSSTSQVELVP